LVATFQQPNKKYRMKDEVYFCSSSFILNTLYLILQMFTTFSVTGCSLELLKVGERGIITGCKIQDEKILKKIISLGLRTGASITLEQHFPSLIIQVGTILLEIEKDVARTIYVRIINN
jgi:ferrous iron transport protein A